MTKVKFNIIVRVKRATVEFAEGMGVGVLVTQEVEFDLPEPYSEHLLVASLEDHGLALLRSAVEVVYVTLD